DLDLENARKVLEDLTELDINIDQVTRDLEEQGIEKFNKPYDNSLKTLEKARKAALAARIDAQIIAVGEDTEQRINRELALWQKVNANQRLWNKDTGLWAVDPEQEETVNRGLGWLDVISAVQDSVEDLTAFRSELLADGFRYVLHMGMGGSSLAPMVFQRSFAVARDGLTLFVLDSTDPATLYDYEQRLPLSQTLFIVASKSGTTAESLAFADYYYSLLKEKLGDGAGAHFAAITDRGTPLAELARERNFRRTFLNFEDIGGRYSALSYFGIVPAALMGLDVSEILTRAQRMLRACAADSPVQKSPGMVLGAALGELARQGRDKITFFVPPAMETLGMWLEQLLAESTGKQGTGLLPVTGEPIAPPSFYGNDRVFVHISLDSEPDDRLARSVAALREAGQPVIAIKMKDRLDVAQEFFRWEIATAAAGAVLGINPFDQPNVQESKDNTNRLLAVVQENGRLPEDKPLLADGGFQLYLPSGMVEPTLPRALAHFFEQVRPGDYIALLAYLTETAAVDTLLGRLRLRLQQQFKTATTLGYGPRYLHSTGQYHKGGPGNGLFVQLTCDDTRDLEVPGRPYTFGAFRQAQARGDLEALVAHERRVLRLHLGADPVQGLGQLRLVLENALSDLNEGR
ncbi:MAG: bifunctional transaldolase/phosoglucose isomerase, partial [Desulfosarcinaceae bacterium]